MLINKTYQTSKYETFIKKDSGKDREIYKLPYFPDRICQWAILQVIEPYLIKTMTTDTYSAIPRRGIHLGLEKITRQIYQNINGTQYCLKLDAKKYYPSINHSILKERYRKLFKDESLLWLLNEIIDSTEENSGIPIGNYLSQYGGNLYFSPFDHWIKEVKHVKYYYRYMDDIVILGNSKEKLRELLNYIDIYFKEELKLTIKNNYQIFPTNVRGIDFLGYRIFNNYVLLRKNTCKRMKKKMLYLLQKCKAGKEIDYSEWCSFNFYKGWLKHCNSYRLTEKYVKPLDRYMHQYYINNIKNRGDCNADI